MSNGPIYVGGTYALTFPVRKDGVAWDLTGGSATLTLYPPNVSSPPLVVTPSIVAGQVVYQTLTTDLSCDGQWQATGVAFQGGLVAPFVARFLVQRVRP